jgi:hypothetical protein
MRRLVRVFGMSVLGLVALAGGGAAYVRLALQRLGKTPELSVVSNAEVVARSRLRSLRCARRMLELIEDRA